MIIIAAIIVVIGLGGMWIWAYKQDIKARDRQYKKFLNDIRNLFYTVLEERSK